jgi:lysophospholipase L1-like esterase
MRELVTTEDVACWDLYRQLGGRGSIDQLHAAGFAADDRLHFRRDGYILIGEMLYELLARAAAAIAKQAP